MRGRFKTFPFFTRGCQGGCLTSSRNFYRIIYCTLQWQVVSLEKRSGNEWLSAMLIPSYTVAQANEFGSCKLQRQRLESIIYFSSLGKIVLQKYVFLCFRIFVLIVWMCPMPYRPISNTFNKRNPNIILITQTGNLKFASGN